ncbi:MAG: DUF3429 domain-containing protein [Porticoccaceae bacterium]|nr:DUF3429 domain-containing protein [Porticoccaceae bacterium]
MDTVRPQQSVSQLVNLLGFAGLIPFVIPVVLMVQGALSANGFESAALFGLYAPYVFITYSAIILSFLCGALWGKTVSGSCRQTSNAVLIFSNLIALCAWSCTLLIYLAPIMSIFAVTLLLAGFLAVLFCERELMAAQEEPDNNLRLSSYWKMRVQLTLMVSALHLVVVYLMILEF